MDDQHEPYLPDQQPDQLPDRVEGDKSKRRPRHKQTGSTKHPGRQRDPGSRKAGLITLCFLIPALVFVVFMQQRSVTEATAHAEANAQQIVPSGRADTFGLISRFTVKFHHLLMSIDEKEGADALDQAGYMDTLDSMTTSPHEMIRAAIVEGELAGEEAAQDRLSGVIIYLAEFGGDMKPEYRQAVYEDAHLVARIYDGEELNDNERQRLIDHHGWHGKLVLTYGMDNDDPERAELIGGGGSLIALLVVFGITVILAIVGGLVLLILGIVLLATGKMKMRFRPPAVGGSVYLETFAVFVGMFMVLQLVSGVLEKRGVPTALIFGMQWITVLSIFWPMVRGVSWNRWRQDMGLVAPRGIVKEIGLGVVSYIACVPLYFGAAAVSLVLIAMRGILFGPAVGEGPAVEAPLTNPVISIIEGSDVATLIVFASLLSVWAPLVEECILRGALFRHIRSRFIFVISGLFSAVLFGMLHQYDVLMLVPIVTLGVMFAFIREWRGSLVGCITAHALHNTTVFILILWIVAST